MPALLDWMKKAARRTLDHRPSTFTTPPPSSATATAPATTGEVTDRYVNHGEIARGGMGAILRVVDKTLRRPLAMKILEPADGNKDASREGLFLEEAQITSQLDHPNICPIHEYGRDTAGTNYFTMKIVRGRTLTDLVHDADYDPANAQSLREALNAMLRVCDALAFAHNKGILHRDLKPDNIMIGDFGQVYLMDWGVAYLMPPDEKRTEPVTVSRTGASATDGAIVGTLMYMPPEQARGAPIDVRTDVFGVGAILYEILTQVPPYFAENIGDLVVFAQGAHWRPPQEMCGTDTLLPAALCSIVEKAMSLDPAMRYQSVPELKAALEEFLIGGMTFPTQTIPAGECVVMEGASGDTAYVIQRGWCRVYKHQDGQQVAFADLGPGDVFGEAAVFADAPRSATIQALTEVIVQVVSKDVFEKDLGMASAMGAFVKALAKRFIQADQGLRASKSEVQMLRAELGRMQSVLSAPLPASEPTYTPPHAPPYAPESMPPLPVVVDPAPTPTEPAPQQAQQQPEQPPQPELQVEVEVEGAAFASATTTTTEPQLPWPTNTPALSTRQPTATKRWSPTPTKMKQRMEMEEPPAPKPEKTEKPAAPPPVALPSLPSLPPLPMASPLSPLALLEVAMKLQTLSNDPKEVGHLLLEALSRGAELLVRERGTVKPLPPA